jgi:TonB-linked SusC/RagA family outer membrane protein
MVVGSSLNEGRTANALSQQDLFTTYLLLENTLTYNKTFGKHTLGLMVGQTVEDNSWENLAGFSKSIPGSEPFLQYMSAGQDLDPLRNLLGSAGEWRMFSYLTRLNYSYNDKYLLTASVRNDNSSKFGKNNRSAIFPAASLAWKIKNETFLKDVDWLYMAKIRLGWGQVGNQNNIAWYHTTTITPGTNYAFGDPKGVSGAAIPGVSSGYVFYGYSGSTGGAPANNDLTWETTQTKDIGVDVSLFENKLSFTADWFLKDNIGMLMQKTVPYYLGFSGPTVNGGKIANQGLEFEVTHRKLEGDFTYDIGFNVTYIKTRVMELDPKDPYMYFGSNDIDGSTLSRTILNGGIADFWGYKTDGVFKNSDEVAKGPLQQATASGGTKPGDIRYVDMNGDGKITLDDYTVIGSPLPDFTFGFTMNFYYKNFDLNIFAQGVQGNQVYNNLYRVMMGPWGVNHSVDILNSWTPTNTETNIPRIEESSLNNNRQILSDRWIEDGSYLRLKTMSLGYTLPKKILSKVSIQNLRVPCSGLYHSNKKTDNFAKQ